MKIAYSLGEFIEIINTLSDDLHHDLVRNDTLLYRGHSNDSFELIPSIGRKINGISNFHLVMFERELINETISKLPTVFGTEKYPVDLLTKLQHFGIPTRLLGQHRTEIQSVAGVLDMVK